MQHILEYDNFLNESNNDPKNFTELVLWLRQNNFSVEEDRIGHWFSIKNDKIDVNFSKYGSDKIELESLPGEYKKLTIKKAVEYFNKIMNS
jgi:hypothetical protein